MPSEPLFAAPYGFAALEPHRSRIERARFVVLPVPYEQTTTFGEGTRSGPEAIIRASREVELWDDDLGTEVADLGIHTRPSLEPSASGPSEMVERVVDAVSEILGMAKVPVLLGGEHTISVGAVRAAAEKFTDLVSVVLDAHADLRQEYQGSTLSHACTARRISEHCPLIHVGMRSLSKGEAASLREGDWRFIPARRVRTDPEWVSDVVAGLEGRPVYLSVDLDVLDPGIMPSVGTPEPGGLSWDEVLALTGSLGRRTDVVGFDVVELSPIPGLIAPDFLAARLVYKLMGQTAHGGC